MTTSDDRVLNVLFGTPETEEEAEQRIRESLRQAGVGPGGPPVAIPPMPAYRPTVPPQPDDHQEPGEDHDAGFSDWWRAKRAALRQAQAPATDDAEDDETPARASNDRLPDWRDPKKPDLADLDHEDEDEDEEPKAHGPRPSRYPVSKTDNSDEDDDQDEAGEEQPTRRRWARPVLGRPPGLPEKKHNVFTWWHGIEPYQKWLAYHATGLAGGIYLGAFSYGFEGAAIVKANDPDDIDVLATYGLGALVLLIDYRLRNTDFLLAWAARGLSTSVALGAIWHSTPLADLGH